MKKRKIRKILKRTLKKERYEHTIGVMYTAAALAMSLGADAEKAMLAGLLHDCGKSGTDRKQEKRCRKHHIPLTEAEKRIPALIHAKLGAYYAAEKFGVEDPEILDAIRFHTTGRKKMTTLEKIIYLADYIEPGREEIPGLAKIRKAAFSDIDQAVLMAAENTLSYLERTGKRIDPATAETCRYYREIQKEEDPGKGKE